MKNKSEYLLKNIGLLTISNFSSKILVFLLVPLYTSVLSTEEYGYYDLAFTTIQLLFPILTLNLSDAVLRFFMDKEADKNNVASYGLFFVLFSSFLTACLLGLNYIFEWNSFLKQYSILILLYYLFYSLNQYFIQFAKGLECVKDLSIASVFGTIAMVGFNLLLLLVFKLGLTGFFYANILGCAIPVIYYIIKLKPHRFYAKVSYTKLLRDMLCYSLPLILTTFGWWINNSSDKYVVSFVCGVAANGLLSVAYKVPSIMNNINQIFIQAWQISAIKENDNRQRDSFYKSVFEYLVFFTCCSAMVLITLAKIIGKILFAKDFFEAWCYTPFLLISMMFCAIAGFLGAILNAEKNSKAMVSSSVVGAATNIALNIGLAYTIGIQGVTIATALSSFIIYFVRLKFIECIDRRAQLKLLLATMLLVVQSVLIIKYSDMVVILFVSPLLMFILFWNNIKSVLYILYSRFVKESLGVRYAKQLIKRVNRK